jgi:hypothetical protein
VLASSAYAAGQLVGYLILAAVVIGLGRTFLRKDLSWREKVLGERKNK